MARIAAVEQRQQSTMELAGDVREKLKNWSQAVRDIDVGSQNLWSTPHVASVASSATS
jgi:hypothetical protein